MSFKHTVYVWSIKFLLLKSYLFNGSGKWRWKSGNDHLIREFPSEKERTSAKYSKRTENQFYRFKVKISNI